MEFTKVDSMKLPIKSKTDDFFYVPVNPNSLTEAFEVIENEVNRDYRSINDYFDNLNI
jgi:hypothetical protein